MQLVLSGYASSKKILGASSFLVGKYLGEAFDVRWLNYGAYDGPLFVGEYVSLADTQDGVESWARDIRHYLAGLDDEFVIFALDDYLLCEPINRERYEGLLNTIRVAMDVVCARLCTNEFYRQSEIHAQVGEFIQLSNQAEYSATTQYCIWRRDYLVELLDQVSTPWEFEVLGSKILNASGYKVIGSRPPALVYPDSSSLSARWQGVNVNGVNAADLATLLELGLLSRDDVQVIG